MASPNFPLSVQQKTILKLIDMLPGESKKKKMEYKMALVFIWLWPEKYLIKGAKVNREAAILTYSFIFSYSVNYSNSYFFDLLFKLFSLGDHNYE